MTVRTLVPILLAVLLAPVAAPAQSAHHHAGMAPMAASPYAGQQQRSIKALAPDSPQQLEQGDGMGLAKAAELNHYPGPRHVLDLADPLALTPQQRIAAESIFAAMRTRATALGAGIIARERPLDAAFAAGSIDAETLSRLTGEIARLQGELRATHLQAHLEMRRLLTPPQVTAYDQLRGYAAP